jgi:hypothetical protein
MRPWNVTAMPPAKCRTTRAHIRPTATREPIGGAVSTLIAAPWFVMSITVATLSTPSGVVSVVRPPTGPEEHLIVGNLGDPRGELFRLVRRGRYFHREAVGELAHEHALDPAELVDIGDDRVADLSLLTALQGKAGRRYVDRPAGIFAAVAKHVASGKLQLDAVVLTASFEPGLE